jgi:hypothetical protein
VEPVVKNLYSVARANANVVRVTKKYQRDQAILREQTVILEIDDIEDFDSGDEERSAKSIIRYSVVNSGATMKTSENRSQTQMHPVLACKETVPATRTDAEVALQSLNDPEIIVIDD